MYRLTFTPNPTPKRKFPKVAEDGQVLSETTPYYVYTCINTKCGVCGWIDRWVSKVDNDKCSQCGKIRVRVANPKQVEGEDYP